jgi:aryl-alcohol dehydrogenase-like predicted oxidoreductase
MSTRAFTRREFLANAAAASMGATLMSANANGQDTKAKAEAMLTRAIPARAGTNSVSGSRLSPGESLPVIGMGTWNTFDVRSNEAEREPLREVLQAFYAAGARVIDSSPMYGSAERVTGDLVSELKQGAHTFYATKVWTSGREAGVTQIDESMRRMRTARLDLLQIHNLVDWRTHAYTLRSLKEAGRIRYSGVTHYTVSSYPDLEAALKAEAFDFVQFNYSIATRNAESRLLPFCQDRGIGVLINRPFEEGALFTRVAGRKLPGYAKELGITNWATFFLKFIVSHPAVTCVIPATSRVAHMQDNLSAGIGPLPDAKLREKMGAEI